jgi:sugar/nucleoside kinase (ribokinase family)
VHNILYGVVCLDIYEDLGVMRPGCGLLHNAYHLRQLGCDFTMVTRTGTRHSDAFLDFFQRNDIPVLADRVVTVGEPTSIRIHFTPEGDTAFSDYREGVWSDFRLTADEEQLLSRADHLHTVAVLGVVPEWDRLHKAGRLDKTLVSADFLSLEHMSLDEFTRLAGQTDLAFIGLRCGPDDPRSRQVQAILMEQRTLGVMTFGAREVLLVDGRSDAQDGVRRFPVHPVEVRGSVNGCGDAFIAYFLADYWRHHDAEQAIAQGMVGGALATEWVFALPEEAYGEIED